MLCLCHEIMFSTHWLVGWFHVWLFVYPSPFFSLSLSLSLQCSSTCNALVCMHHWHKMTNSSWCFFLPFVLLPLLLLLLFYCHHCCVALIVWLAWLGLLSFMVLNLFSFFFYGFCWFLVGGFTSVVSISKILYSLSDLVYVYVFIIHNSLLFMYLCYYYPWIGLKFFFLNFVVIHVVVVVGW